MRAQGSSPQFTIKYWQGDQNATSQVTDGTYVTAQLVHGERSLVRVQIKAKATSASTARVTATIRVRSSALATARDVVKVTAER